MPGLALWLVGAGVGLAMLDRYDATPGSVGVVPVRWPVESRLAAPSGRPTLLVFLHAQCVCSRATLTEVEAIAAATRGALAIRLVMLDGTGAATSDLWTRAVAVPGAVVVRDPDGAEARRFGAATSGQTMLYDGAGALQFAGGVTAGRSVVGDNVGREAIVALVAGDVAARERTPAFGCPLQPVPATAAAA